MQVTCYYKYIEIRQKYTKENEENIMNDTLKVNELTQSQREQIILSSDKTWADVESVNVQLRKDGSVSNYTVNYKYGEVEEAEYREAVKFFNGLKAITKHGVTVKAEKYADRLNKKAGV